MNQKKLLYSPYNWTFLAFLFSPILPAIFYYRNSKLLGESSKGKKVLIGSIIFVLVVIAITFSLSYYSTLILIIEIVIAIVVAKKLSKQQIPAYKKYREANGLKRDRNEIPLILLFVVIWVTFGFVIPYFMNKYIEDNYHVSSYRGETMYIPKSNKDIPKKVVKEPIVIPEPVIEPDPIEEPVIEEKEIVPSIEGVIDLSLPDTHVLDPFNMSVLDYGFAYDIQLATSSYDSTSWLVHVVTLEAVQHFDEICPPGDCMRSALVFPKESFFLKDKEALENDEEPIVSIFNGQKYYPFTMPVDGDVGFNRLYITYFNDIRVVFVAYAATPSEAEKLDAFMKDVEIKGIK